MLSLGVLRERRHFHSSTAQKTQGTIKRVTRLIVIPPTEGIAIGFITSAPRPVAQKIGIKPTTMVAMVMRQACQAGEAGADSAISLRSCCTASEDWRRGESNPCPSNDLHNLLHVYTVFSLGEGRRAVTRPSPERPRNRFIQGSGRSIPDQPAVVAFPASRRHREHVVAQLGRECEIFVICFYLFDPIFYEANESSSTCRPGFTLKVETITPPLGIAHYAWFFKMQATG